LHPQKERFVENRINKIRESNWPIYHVDGKMNPADIASRGCSPQELRTNDLWWHGPEWIIKGHYEPSLRYLPGEEFKENTNSPAFILSIIEDEDNKKCTFNYEQFSSYTKIISIARYTAKFLKICCQKLKRENSLINHLQTMNGKRDEWQTGVTLLIADAQQRFPPLEETKLNLNLFNEHGILKCKGRIGESRLSNLPTKPIRNNDIYYSSHTPL
jgi:hypothetical protein